MCQLGEHVVLSLSRSKLHLCSEQMQPKLAMLSLSIFIAMKPLVYCYSFPPTEGVNQCLGADASLDGLYEDNPNRAHTVDAYVTADLTWTLCSLTKAFLFRRGVASFQGIIHRGGLCPAEDPGCKHIACVICPGHHPDEGGKMDEGP